MCLLSPKVEEEYVPARVTKVRRTSRVSRRSPSPPRELRVRQSETIVEERRPEPPPPIILPPSPRASATIHSERRTSRVPSRAPSARIRSETHFVEVDHETSSSSSSSSEDVRSRTTHKSSRSKTTAPRSEYSMHEREYRRERDYRAPKPEYETYRYVDAPPERRRSVSRGPARSSYDDRDAYRRETKIHIDTGRDRRTVDYKR